MARTTAPSLWLPGFDPEPRESPDLFGAPETARAHLANGSADSPDELTAKASAPTWAAWRPDVLASPTPAMALWPTLTRVDLQGLDGSVTKFTANLAAIEALRLLETEGRQATSIERAALLRYTGWGGLPASFNLDGNDPAWRKRATSLRAALPDADYESARASVTSSHYTELRVIEAMWQAVENFGFTGGRILEPAAGIGHFIGAMPRSLAERSRITAIEIDRLSGRLLKALYGPAGVDVLIAPFEKTTMVEDWFDLVIGNVPFGKYQVADHGNRAYTRFSIHNYFFGRALDMVRPGGLVCLITSSHTMESHNEGVREYIASQAQLLGAIRLPQGAFAGLASTQVQTDILFLRKRRRGEVTEEAQPSWLNLTLLPESLREGLIYSP